MFGIGGPELVIIFGFMALGLIPLVLGVVVAVDASKYSEAAFERAGTSKTLWIVLPLVSVVVCGIGTIIAAIAWYTSYKPRVIRGAQGQGGAAAS